MEIKKLIGAWSVILLLTACKQGQLPFLVQSYPHEDYGNQLKKQGLEETSLGRQWLQRAEWALQNPVSIDIPFSLNGVFYTDDIEAGAWRFSLKQGSALRIHANWKSPDSSRLFMDVFFFEDGKWEHVGAAEKGTCHLDFECTEDGEYLLRLQPELLGAGQYSLTLERTPTYSAFPVQGKDSRAIWSVFGDDRDGGKRRHEGIDIFAERGTPVVAPVSGVVSSIRNGGLGGKSVWMRDHTRGHSLYFAHLDSQAVNSGKSVKTGDTLGFVGNTGNARNTKPHLHFGIYVRFQGAIDPYPFVDNQLREAPVINGFPTERYQVVNGAKANFRQGPAMDFKVISSLDEGDLVWVKGQTNEWVQVETPDLRSGFIHSSLLTLPSPNVESGKERWAFWDPFVHPADSFQLREGRLAVLGSFKGYRWARDEEGHSFWISSN